MLGEKLGESSGRITGTRIITEGSAARTEVSQQGRGTLLGVGVVDIGTYWTEIRSGGVLYSEGTLLFLTDQGETLTWRGFAVGRPTGPYPALSAAVAGAFQTESAALARLNGVATVVEYASDAEGNYHWDCWEWKGPGM